MATAVAGRDSAGKEEDARAAHARGADPDGGARGYGGGRALGALLVVAGFMGLLAAWVITLDEFHLLKDPNFTPGCSLNPVVSCGSVMKSAQASVFGFPNPMLGLATYPVVVATGAGLLAGARYGRWYWLGLNAGTLFGVGFCSWLQFQSLYEINALCLWCCLAWTGTTLAFCYVTVHNIRNGVIAAPAGLRTALGEFHWLVPLVWLGGIGMLILTRWWDFWTG
ncbi:vitamin K epoxide reductase family protein [Streptomyces sp. 8L]|uniref:vitamin K epoxide reductase family protein n=1 Tax=Streptomyces sp. 8L TaxID=2877242 RepID=UPI001CD26ACF|nr:vitamin K epoxide reductase family protein [Streptomyces sp. 8L]MCA1221749.1 vitamin K epoxide reductase family protein [Streptomyces sp. 8L]